MPSILPSGKNRRGKVCVTCAIALLFLGLPLAACHTPRDFEAELSAAESKVGMGDAEGALHAYRKIADRFPDDPRRAGVLMHIALLYATTLADEEMAIRSFGRVIDGYPLSEAARLARERRAELSLRRGEFDGAIGDYSGLLKLDPEHPEARRWRLLLAGAYLSQRNFRQARLELIPLVDDPQSPPAIREQALFTVAESFFLEGNLARAVPFYEELLRAFPQSPLASEAELHLASCLEEMGYLGTARDLTRDAARDYPNRKVIDARLKSLQERGGKSQGAR